MEPLEVRFSHSMLVEMISKEPSLWGGHHYLLQVTPLAKAECFIRWFGGAWAETWGDRGNTPFPFFANFILCCKSSFKILIIVNYWLWRTLCNAFTSEAMTFIIYAWLGTKPAGSFFDFQSCFDRWPVLYPEEAKAWPFFSCY